MDPQTEVEDIVRSLQDLQVRMSNLDHARFKEKEVSGACGSMSAELAEYITAIVGLREAIVSEYRLIRYIWTVLFVVGLGATAYYLSDTLAEFIACPTSTSVYLKSESDYEFPPLLLCPAAWFDAERAYQMGLSTEALKYSLSYADAWFVDQFQDIHAARQEFLDFYKIRNYSSLLEYFSDISQELRPKASSGDSATWYEARSCNLDMSKTFGRTTMGKRFCYIFHVKPMEHGFGIYSGVRRVEIQYQAKTAGLVPSLGDWDLYFSPRLDLFETIHPAITIRASRKSAVKLSVKKFISLNTKKRECNTSDDSDLPYTEVKCMTKCHNDLHLKTRGCRLIWLVQDHLEMQPEDTCNWADRIPPENWTLSEYFDTNVNAQIDAIVVNRCLKQCPRKCDKVVYDTILQEQQSFPESQLKYAKRANASLVQVTLRHGNVYQGGTVISEERYIYSFTQLVNNIGGTLGLFVGATLMTFVQLLLFCVTCALGMRARARAAGKK